MPCKGDMKRKRIKIPAITAKNLIPSSLQIHVFTEQAEAALNRAIHGPMATGSTKRGTDSRVGCA